MMPNIEIGDIITVNNTEYTVLDIILYEDIKYSFVNVWKGEEPSEEFLIFKMDGDNVEVVKDEKISNVLLPIFSNNVQKSIDKFKMEEKYNIN